MHRDSDAKPHSMTENQRSILKRWNAVMPEGEQITSWTQWQQSMDDWMAVCGIIELVETNLPDASTDA